MEERSQNIVFSGIKPTGKLTIGNYIGAIKNMVEMQDSYQCFYSVADLHSITVDVAPPDLRQNTLNTYALFRAFGIDSRSVLFVQSHVTAHAQLTWLLNCYTQFGEAKRMTQFKDKSIKSPENVNVGLFDYPVLMAADILLYRANFVPVGTDQKQHVELARTIAQRFNNKYSETFVLPDVITPKHGAKIYSLLDPAAKMGKTDDNENACVYIMDSPEDIMRKFKRAVTDSDKTICYQRAQKPGISNLLTIYSAFTGESIAKTVKEFENTSYADFKIRVAEAVIEGLRPVQTRFGALMKDKSELMRQMRDDARKAEQYAARTLRKVYKKIGFLQLSD